MIVATHPSSPTAPDIVRQYVTVGASPRGAQALLVGARVNALLEGRYNVAFEDLHAVARPALRHRILLNFEGQADRITPEQIVDDVLKLALKPA
jgi:MoxR-like ATPase